MSNLFIPSSLISRRVELEHISQILQQDGDFLVVGAPGTGRHTLIRAAAEQVGARIIEIDCLRSTSANRFLRLLADGLTEAFPQPDELAQIAEWSGDHALGLEHLGANRPRLTWQGVAGKEWGLFQTLLALPQRMAEWLDCRVVIVFQNFPHIRSWDRSGKWEHYLRQEVQRQSRVSYALVTTVAEPWVQDSHHLQVITLAPLGDRDLEPWIVPAMADVGLQFDSESQALSVFLGYVQGHLGDAIALARRIWLDHRHSATSGAQVIRAEHVHRSIANLVDDLALTFESLILLLPPSQVRVLESLALDPTDKPHARDYIEKHQLSRGGGLQGALTSLEHKGLVYGPKYGYKIAMPFLAFWLRQQLA